MKYIRPSPNIALGLLLLISKGVFCLHALTENEKTKDWFPSLQQDADFTHMVQSNDGSRLVIAGKNKIYSLNTSSFSLIEEITTLQPTRADPSVANVTTLMLHGTSPIKSSDEEFVTICGTASDVCHIRRMGNISDYSIYNMKVHTRGVTGMVYSLPSTNYVFIGCPHNDNENVGICSIPGLYCYKDNITKVFSMKFKTGNIETEKFVSSFSVPDYQMLFSVQKMTSSDSFTRVSKVALTCLKIGNEATTTAYRYTDMPLRCGDYNITTAVAKIQIDISDEIVIVAIFSSSHKHGSAVCAFTYTSLKSRLTENMKRCFTKTLTTLANSDNWYIDITNKCSNTFGGNLTEPDKYYLCSDFPSYTTAIGDLEFRGQPVVTHSSSEITAVALSLVRGKVVAFLGTSNGHLYKKVVFPSSVSMDLADVGMVDSGQMILPDMYVSPSGQNLYALTKNKVFGLPVEMCGDYSTCGDCLQSRDPYCGWCMLETRCSTMNSCVGSEWIGTTDSSSELQCPHVVSIGTRDVLPYNDTQPLEVTLSHELAMNEKFRCVFTTDISPDYKQTTHAYLDLKPKVLKCNSSNVAAIANKINGYANISLSIMGTKSSSPIATGQIVVYNCNTFRRCGDCVSPRWGCIWCKFRGQCYRSTRSCPDGTLEEVGKGRTDICPRVSRYESPGGTLGPGNLTHISSHSDYTINVYGSNFITKPDKTSPLIYRCVAMLNGEVEFNATRTDSHIECHIRKGSFTVFEVKNRTQLYVTLEGAKLDGDPLNVVFYDCKHVGPGCGKCQSLQYYQPYFKCRWCGGKCIDNGTTCTGNMQCYNSTLTGVFPLSGHMNASVMIDIIGENLGSHYNDTINAVTVAEKPCTSIEERYIPSERISCLVEPSYVPLTGPVVVKFPRAQNPVYGGSFSFRDPNITSIFPAIGPLSGGTIVTLRGHFLRSGRDRQVWIGQRRCHTIEVGYTDQDKNTIVCKTSAYNGTSPGPVTVNIELMMDNVTVDAEPDVNFTYSKDPVIKAISPRESFNSGGRRLTIEGEHLDCIQKPKIYAILSNTNGPRYDCSSAVDSGRKMICPSPANQPKANTNRRKRSNPTVKLAFEMDDVMAVRNLPDKLPYITYYPDPTLRNMSVDQQYSQVLRIEGEGLNYAASMEDTKVLIGCGKCNITNMNNDSIFCTPPTTDYRPICQHDPEKSRFTIKVEIGFMDRTVGFMVYPAVIIKEDTNWALIIGIAVGAVVLVALVGIVVIFKYRHMARRWMEEKRGLEYRMDKMESTFRNQCREEFAALQTAMSDLSSELEGQNELFWDYEQYACKTLFTINPHPLLSPPTVTTDKVEREMESFKALLRNQQFLLLFIKTLEKQKSFTINDKTKVATILIVLNHDNMEYITGILKILLNDLIDKNVTVNTPKLLLRKSESVAEKLLTHWLSVCLYHYLKEGTGSALYTLYKAIKIQVYRGPVDHITFCAKYTLSEDKLYTVTDTDGPSPQMLILEVKLEGADREATVPVLECDTISQAKGKMLEMLYKNVGYSHRPSLATTALEIEEGGARRVLSDEDASSKHEGLWKKINTLQHYKVKDGTKVYLYLNRQPIPSSSSNNLSTGQESSILGSLRRSKPVARTKSGSNFWHLMKHHTEEDEIRLASDLFLPRLVSMKGILQQYIDEFYTAILSVPEETPLIIKYLYDFLDAAAERCLITDPDVLHTWKCNSLLLRFWVNIIKNPEFVFDIQKPLIVDSCLSVIAQTLMDSCSTASLTLGPGSPSNKLLFAKDIPVYKEKVKDYFQEMKKRPAVSDQEFNSFLTEKVSQKYSGKFYQSTAILEMYTFANKYRNEIANEMDNQEAENPGHMAPLTSKLQCIFMSMDMLQKS